MASHNIPYLATTSYVVRHKAKVTIRRNKTKDSVTLPLLVPHTGMEGDIIKESKYDDDDNMFITAWNTWGS